MIRNLFIITFTLLSLNIMAQQSFTDRLVQRPAGKGRVTLHQSEELTKLVNGQNDGQANKQAKGNSQSQAADTLSNETPDEGMTVQTGHRVTMSGYRIQVYSGGNSRQSKQQAESAAARVRIAIPDESVYTNFISPRWVCRVGDYRSYEEAYQALHALKENGNFGDAVIVKSKIQVHVD